LPSHSTSRLVITDVRMPEIEGLELIRRLDAMGVALPIIVITDTRCSAGGRGHEIRRPGLHRKADDDELMIVAVRAAVGAPRRDPGA